MGEALAGGIELETVLATPDFLASPEGAALCRRLATSPLASLTPLVVAPELLADLADADSPRGLLAVARLPRPGVAALPLRPGAPYLYLDGLQDPGNLGALARVAEAAGAAGLALAPGSVHPNHPRALRGSAGSLLRLPVAVGVSPDDLARHLAGIAEGAGVTPRWAALVPRGGADLYATRLVPPAPRAPGRPPAPAFVLALGAEGPGLSPEADRRADLRLTIPLAPPVESLNAVVAAALVLFELRRQQGLAVGESMV